MRESDGENEAGDPAQREPDEALQRRVRRILGHDPEPALAARAFAQKVRRDLVQVGKLVAGQREEDLGGFPDHRHRADHRQRAQRLART